jgi:hypothetical protein
MKTKIYLFVLASFLLGLNACNDEFLEQYPQTAITPEGFFRTVNDLQLYVSGLNNDGKLNLGGWYEDLESDNVAIGTNWWATNNMYSFILKDTYSPQNVELNTWNKDAWGSLRSVNLMLSRLDQVEGSAEDINHYAGIARYYRAWFYIEKVKNYSDVPWIDKPLSGDDELLYAGHTPRAEVVQHIIEDLDFAAANIQDKNNNNKTNISRYCALALLSRFALYEGTFRKYHSELGLSGTANEFLQKAVDASLQVINSGLFSIAAASNLDLGNGMTGSESFRNLFSSFDLGSNPEIIKWVERKVDVTGAHNADRLMNNSNYYSLNRSLQESFLTKDGLPYSTVPNYDKKTYAEVFVDRDPRLAETVAYPGAAEDNEGVEIPHRTPPTRGGYDQIKYFVRQIGREYKTPNGLGQYNGLPIYRYGEVLLNYAEAKAELGQFDQAVADLTVNRLRDRVGMPHFNASREVDATLQSLYPNVSDQTILALRRERRVELACEGLRLWDINRWYAGKVFELDISKQGIYVPSLPYLYDVSNDGVNDYGIITSDSQKTDEEISWLTLNDPGEEGGFYRDAAGFLRNGNDQNRRFIEPKHYYRPIPQGQIVLNPNLIQPYGW